jgi:hypothetical protein
MIVSWCDRLKDTDTHRRNPAGAGREIDGSRINSCGYTAYTELHDNNNECVYGKVTMVTSYSSILRSRLADIVLTCATC